MFSKSFIALIVLVASISSANAHAGVSPALGVKGQMTRGEVQRPSANAPCGNANIAQNLDSSTAVPADASGNFSPSITNFNGGADGSRSIKQVLVDASGTGKNMVPAKMVVNGDANPTGDSTQQLTAQLPPGTKCSGGANKDLCLASFTTTAGFGNCVVVSQGAANGASKAPAARSMSDQSNVVRNGAAKGVSRSTDPRAAADDDQAKKNGQAQAKDGKKKKDNKKKKGGKKGEKGKKAKAKGEKAVTPSTDSRAATGDPANQPEPANKAKDEKKKDGAKKKNNKKGKKKGKGDKKAATPSTDTRVASGNDAKQPDQANNSKDEKNKKDNGKKKDKKGKKGKGGKKGDKKGDGKQAKASPNGTPARSWSSRQVHNVE